MPAEQESQFEFISEESLENLNFQQKILYSEHRQELIQFLREKGKNPRKHIGYEESNIPPLARRIHQVFVYAWENDRLVLELTTELADQFVEDLNQDAITTNEGEAYAEGSKQKFNNALQAYFRYKGQEWEPEISFSDETPTAASDPLNKREREQLLNAALDYKSPPSYSNLTPEERDRWKAHIAQYKGIPKEEVSREHFEELQRTWKWASLISTALDAGWRAEIVGRLETAHVDLENEKIHIPGEIAVKNDENWTVELSTRSVRMLERWLPERENNTKYDDTDKLWLNRQGNPYNSATLNSLLDNLLDEAGINPAGRKITWHSIRHSTGMYIYDLERDLGLVAEILRHKSIEAARKYAHPTPETKRDVIEGIQGGAPA